jgi:hypothetical protein
MPICVRGVPLVPSCDPLPAGEVGGTGAHWSVSVGAVRFQMDSLVSRGIRLGIALAAIAGSLVACGSSRTASSTTTKVSIPLGWKTETYGQVAMAVPSNWAVKHGTNCPNATAPGTLLLGLPAVPSNCAEYQYPKSVVTVWQISSETSTTNVPTEQRPVTINGVPVYVALGSPATLYWIVPSLTVQITGSGPESSQVMHTLHKA